MADNEQVQTTVEIPEPLTPEDFRKYLTTDVKENTNLEPGEELSDDEAYRIGIDALFEGISNACVNSDPEEMYNLVESYGFYNEEELYNISTLELSNQAEMVPSIMRSRIADIEDVAPAFNFYDTYTQFESAKNVLQLNQTLHKLESFSSRLTDKVKGQMYFNASLRYQEFAFGNKLDYQYAKGQELNMLKKTLFYTADPEIIATCEQRIDPNSKDASLIKISYKNALNKTDDVEDLYKIHLNLGQIYYEESKIPGYRYPQSVAVKSLNKAINHYHQASQLAGTPEDRLSALRSLANVQKNADNIDEWAITKCEIANLISNPNDRYNYLINTAQEMSVGASNRAEQIMRTTLKAIKKDQSLEKGDKNRLLLNAYAFLDKTTKDPIQKADFQKKMLCLQKQSIRLI